MTIILTDVDDTILDCADTLQAFIEQRGFESKERLKDHHNIPALFGISLDQTLDLIAEFHRSETFASLPPMDCAVTVLPKLYRRGYRFVAITACLDEEAVVEARRTNLEAVFGFPWEAIHCIGLKPCKKEALALHDAAIWVDDLAHHAAAGAELGHRSFLIHKPYNKEQHHPDVIRVNDWHDIDELLG